MSHIPLMLTFFIFASVTNSLIQGMNLTVKQMVMFSTCTGFGKFNVVCALNHPPLINHAT